MPRGGILVVDDEPGVRLALTDELESEGFLVKTAVDGREAHRIIASERFALVVLDVMMPALNGFELCRRLREEGNDVPILFLTAKSEDTDILVGLGFGADDYVTKPFNIREVMARIEAILRRAAKPEPPSTLDRLTFADITVDFVRFEAKRGEEQLELTPREFRILRLLGERAGEVVTRDEILDRIWGEEVYVNQRSVDNQVYTIRQQIEVDPKRPRYLISIRGVGYKLVPEGI